MMFDIRRQHPVAAITKVLEIIRGNFITILLILFVGGSGDEQSLFNMTWIFGTIIVLFFWGILSWLRFTYRIEDEQLIIEQGVLMHQKLYISKDRIQVIDITSGVIQRLFGLVQVEVKTAGSSTKGAQISAVTKEVAYRLRERLQPEKSAEPAEDREPAVDDASGEAKPKSAKDTAMRTYRLGIRDLVVAASTSGSLGVALSIVGTAFSQIDQVVSEEQMIRYIESVIPSSASTSLIITSVLFILLLSWILSFMGTVIKYSGFRVILKEEVLVVTRGLFEKKQLTIPYDRIQALQVKEELLRQPFGYVTLKLDSAGYGDEGGKSVILFPVMPRERVAEFIRDVLPEYDHRVASVRPPSVSLRRYLFRSVLISQLIILPVWLFVPMGVYAFALVVPALVLGYAQYQDTAVGADGHTLILRYRILSRNTVIIKRHRIQTVESSSNPFQRRTGLANFSVTVASGSEGHEFTIRYLADEAAAFFRDWASHNRPLASEREEEQREAVETGEANQKLPDFK